MCDKKVKFFDFFFAIRKNKKCNRHEIRTKKTVTDIPKSLTHLPSFYQSPSEKDRFDRMGAQILAAKRRKNITMELCLYGWGNVEDWGYRYGQLWRTSNDIRKGTFISYLHIL